MSSLEKKPWNWGKTNLHFTKLFLRRSLWPWSLFLSFLRSSTSVCFVLILRCLDIAAHQIAYNTRCTKLANATKVSLTPSNRKVVRNNIASTNVFECATHGQQHWRLPPPCPHWPLHRHEIHGHNCCVNASTAQSKAGKVERRVGTLLGV